MNQPELADQEANAAPPAPCSIAELLATVTRELSAPAAVSSSAVSSSAAAAPVTGANEEAAAAGQKFVLFSLGATHCAVPLAGVLEIQRLPTITPLPLVPPWLVGIANLRGEILSVVELGQFLGLTEPNPSPRRRLMVVQPADAAFSLGLVVDQVDAIRALEVTHMRPLSADLNQLETLFVCGTLELDATFRAVLDLERLLHSPRLTELEVVP